MRIGEVARQTGLEASAIRFYEDDGIVPEPRRTEAGYRDYDENDMDLLHFVRRLRALELPLDAIRQIVSLRREGRAPCVQVRGALEREAASIDRRIQELIQLRAELTTLGEAADEIVDDWPYSCVCHLLTRNGRRQERTP